ncbi:MAG: PQQ-binding-like beta-propeller repeat protein [Planctomycetota bacterium]
MGFTGLLLLFLLAGEEEVAPPPFVWNQLQGNAARDNYRTRADGIVWPKVAWRVPGLRGQPTYDGRFVYAGGDRLARVDARSGEVIHALGGTVYGEAPVIGERVLIARRADGSVVAYSLDLQRELWRHAGPKASSTKLTGALSGRTYVFAAGKIVRALDARNGKLFWEWSAGDAKVRCNPAIADGRVFVGDDDDRLTALDLKTGREVWNRHPGSPSAWTHPAVLGGHVVVALHGGTLLSLDPKDGRTRWVSRFGSDLIGTPGRGPGRLVVANRRLAKQLDLETGRPLEPVIHARITVSPTLVGKTIYFGNFNGQLCAHDAKTGVLLWKFEVPGYQPTPMRPVRHRVHDFVHTGSQIFVATSNGLYCLVQDPEKRGKRPSGTTISTKDG